jgi:hypothetical protein
VRTWLWRVGTTEEDTKSPRRRSDRGFSDFWVKSWRLKLSSLDDFAALDAAGADLYALAATGRSGLDRLKIRVPATTGYVVRVRNVVAKLRAFAAKLTYLCHDLSPNKT